MIVAVSSISLSYFGANIISKDIKETKVTTGVVDLKVDDEELDAKDIAPIYDTDYEMLAYKKNFSIISSEKSLNSCTKVSLNIDTISSELANKYFKYKIVGNDYEKEGNFSGAHNNSNLTLIDNVFIEGNSSMDFDLYIWISYDENENQIDMLGTKLIANIVVEGKDSKNLNYCK